MEEGYRIIRISQQEYRTAIPREHKLFALSKKNYYFVACGEAHGVMRLVVARNFPRSERGSKHGNQNPRWSRAIF